MINLIFKVKIEACVIAFIFSQIQFKSFCPNGKIYGFNYEKFANQLFKFNKKANDTTFLLKETKHGNYHSVYTDNNSNSLNYRKLLDFSCLDEENENLSREKNGPKKYSKMQSLYNLPKEWLPLYQYKKKYYLYAPSDWGNVNKKLLSNAGVISWNMEGCSFDSLKLVKKISSNGFLLKIKNASNEGIYKILIHIIDKKRKVAVWEYVDRDNHSNFTLYVAKEDAIHFKLIVNYCNTMKQPEFEFEKINYKKLLTNKYFIQ